LLWAESFADVATIVIPALSRDLPSLHLQQRKTELPSKIAALADEDAFPCGATD
jgi:hypothetical protein